MSSYLHTIWSTGDSQADDDDDDDDEGRLAGGDVTSPLSTLADGDSQADDDEALYAEKMSLS